MPDDPSKTTGKRTGKSTKPTPTTLAAASRIESVAGDPPTILHVALESPGSAVPPTDEVFWKLIRRRTTDMSFKNYEVFIKEVFCGGRDLEADEQDAFEEKGFTLPNGALQLPSCYHGQDAYNLLKAATEVFLVLQCGVKRRSPEKDTDFVTALSPFLNPGTLPYLDRILEALRMNDPSYQAKSPLCEGILRPTIDEDTGRDIYKDKEDRCYPCLLELIWSYWHEEGMLVQTLNALCLRFQNKRGPHARDPLANLRLDPLRPLNTLLWNYIQDETNRLTVARRAYEYDHEYGLRLVGRAVEDMQTVDSRSKFLEAFHNLLYVTGRFYKEADDKTISADAFPLLNALRELHLILAQGAHNQFGDLPWTARVEMLIQKWLLARPEIREFLGGAPMVPYKESWMAHADSMKALQGWTDVSVTHFRDLGVYGEQILLSVRWNDWLDDTFTQANASNWAISWRPEIQSYIHSYRAVTGVDLSSELADTRSAAARNVQPAIHQMRRLQLQRNSNLNGGGYSQGTVRRLTAASRNGQAVYRRNGL
jgi:hypothetical protein